MRRALLIVAGLIYVGGGAECAREIGAIPAVNTLGKLYVAATWPAWVHGSPFPAPPVPAWAFTFKDS